MLCGIFVASFPLTPLSEDRANMTRFIEVLGGDETWHFINFDQITKVECKVERWSEPAALEASSLSNSEIPTISPARQMTKVSIRVLTAKGDGEVCFDSESEAEIWAVTELGIADIILRSQTLER